MDVPLSTSTVLATRDELFSANEQLALAGFLAGYRVSLDRHATYIVATFLAGASR